ncbi:hypothetical protein Bca101_052975 [Brassica carinata]
MAKPLGTTGEFFRRRDEWRKHPMLSNQMRHALPGLGIGVAAFCVYLVGEQIYNKALAPSKSSSHHNQNQPAPAVDATESTNSTRRELSQVRNGRKLRKRSGRCVAYNPIDKCWRCHGDWEKNRKKLADCVLGFGRRTTGGKDGPIYVVNDASDDDLINPKPGTLRHAVTRDGPLWIIFGSSMIINLRQELMITSDKTIDGRGARVYIMGGAGLTLQFVNNVIIHNIYIKHVVPKSGGLIRDSEQHIGLRTVSDGDGISLFGATNVWIDHVSMTRCSDGMIDAILGSTAITISNSHFTDHEEMYAIGGNMNPTIISQGNRFIAPPNEQAKQITKREYTPYTAWKTWNWQSEGDYFLNGAYFVQSGKLNAWSPKPVNPVPKKFAIRPQPGTMVRKLTMEAGVIGCKQGIPC